MRYLTQPKFKKYVKGYGFLSFARKYGDKYGQKLIDTAAKTGTNYWWLEIVLSIIYKWNTKKSQTR